MRPILLLLALLILAPASSGQGHILRIPPRGEPTVARVEPLSESADTSSVVAADSLSTAAKSAPRLLTFQRSGLRVTLRGDWQGVEEIDETRFPSYAVYTFTAQMPGTSLAGARLRIERITGLNPIDEQRWRTGQIGFGYHDTRPTGLTPVDMEGSLGFEVTGVNRQGVLAFVRRGRTYWTILATGTPASWALDYREIEDLLYTVELPQ